MHILMQVRRLLLGGPRAFLQKPGTLLRTHATLPTIDHTTQRLNGGRYGIALQRSPRTLDGVFAAVQIMTLSCQ